MKKIFIAPIAGVTDYTYRGILEEFHPDLLFTEMVSSDALAALRQFHKFYVYDLEMECNYLEKT